MSQYDLLRDPVGVIVRGVARNSFWVGIIFYCTILQSYTSSLTTSALTSAQNNFQGLILGGHVYRYTPRRYVPGYPPFMALNGL